MTTGIGNVGRIDNRGVNRVDTGNVGGIENKIGGKEVYIFEDYYSPCSPTRKISNEKSIPIKKENEGVGNLSTTPEHPVRPLHNWKLQSEHPYNFIKW